MFTKDSRILSHKLTVPLTSVSKAVGDVFRPTFDQPFQSLFANNEQGFFYDPNDLSTMFQDAAGTVPVTAAGQPVGLMLDKSKGLMLGVDDFNDANITFVGGSSRVSTGVYRLYSSDGTYSLIDKLNGQSKPTSGKAFLISFNVDSVTVAGSGISIEGVSAAITLPATIGKKTCIAISNGLSTIGIKRGGTAMDVKISDISVKELSGNHAYQTTSARRPIFEQKPVLGTNFVTDSTLATPNSWSTSAVSGVSVSDNKLIFNNVAAYHASVTSRLLSTRLFIGKRYLLSYIISGYVSGAVRAQLTGGATTNTTSFNKNGRVSLVITATERHSFIGFQSTAAGTTLNISKVYLQEITGYLTDQNHIKYDGVDDRLVTNLPTQLTGCTVIRSVPNVGTQILTNQTVLTPYNDNIDNCGLIVINRALTPSETSAITDEFNKRAGV